MVYKMITCPECSTEYEKEAKYCFKCRIPFTDDIPDNIKKYLKPRGGSPVTNPNNRSNTTPLPGSAADKPPLQRNVSLPVFKNNAGNNNSVLIPTSSTSPPNINPIGTHASSSASNLMTNLTSPPATGTNRPRLQSTPTPPSHPLPPVPNRMSVPISHSPPTVLNINSNSRQPPPPPNNSSNNSNTGTPSKSTPTMHNPNPPPSTAPRTVSPTMASPDNSHPTGFTDEHPSNNFIKRPLSRRIPPPPPNKKLVRAVWDCVPEQEGDLEFYVGDIISVITKDDESGWWLGTLNGRTGLFPRNYVQDME